MSLRVILCDSVGTCFSLINLPPDGGSPWLQRLPRSRLLLTPHNRIRYISDPRLDLPAPPGQIQTHLHLNPDAYPQKIDEMDHIIVELEHKLAFGEAAQIQSSPRPLPHVHHENLRYMGLKGKLAASKVVAEEVFACQEKWLK